MSALISAGLVIAWPPARLDFHHITTQSIDLGLIPAIDYQEARIGRDVEVRNFLEGQLPSADSRVDQYPHSIGEPAKDQVGGQDGLAQLVMMGFEKRIGCREVARAGSLRKLSRMGFSSRSTAPQFVCSSGSVFRGSFMVHTPFKT